MKVCPTLICFLLLSSLQDGNTGLINGKVYSGIKGQDVTVKCSFFISRTWKFFCKDKCEADDVLIQTTGNRAETGRYSIRYEGGFVSGGDLSVTITQLTSSDSGQYRCGLGESLSSASYEDVEIMVADELLEKNHGPEEIFTVTGGKLTVACSFGLTGSSFFFCREECEGKDVLVETDGVRAQRDRYSITYSERSATQVFVSVTITQLTESDSGRYRCGLGRFPFGKSHRDFDISVVDALLNDPAEKPLLFTRTGGNLRVACSFAFTGSFKFLCKDQCEGKNILVQTDEDRSQKDRYSIRYLEISATKVFLLVTITQLTESDSGLYRCSLDRSSHRDFTISVTDAPSTSEPILAVQPVTSAPSALTQTTDQSDGQTQRPGVILSVRLTLVVIIILSSAAVLIFCRRKTTKAKDPPVETEYVPVIEAGRVNDDTREEEGQDSSPVEISSVYTKYTKPSKAETSDDHSSVTAAALSTK